jgi:hypothetical protein
MVIGLCPLPRIVGAEGAWELCRICWLRSDETDGIDVLRCGRVRLIHRDILDLTAIVVVSSAWVKFRNFWMRNERSMEMRRGLYVTHGGLSW